MSREESESDSGSEESEEAEADGPVKLRPKMSSSDFLSGLGADVLWTTSCDGSISCSLVSDAASGLMLYWRAAAWKRPSGDRRGATKAGAARGAHRGRSWRSILGGILDEKKSQLTVLEITTALGDRSDTSWAGCTE